MTSRIRSRIVVASFIVCMGTMAAGLAYPAGLQGTEKGWVVSWTAPPQEQVGEIRPLADVTVRSVIPLATGGRGLRIRFSNEYGTRTLFIGSASVGVVDSEGRMRPDTLRRLSFGGHDGIAVPAAAPAYSDPVELDVPAGGLLAVSLYLPRETLPRTWHRVLPGQDVPGDEPSTGARILAGGDATARLYLEGGERSPHLFLTRVDVLQPRARTVVAVLGTTRTDGAGRWPDYLNQRLNRTGRAVVVNASMVANPLTRPYRGGGDAGLARFDRDVLALPGVTHVVIADAINDIGQVGTVQNGQPVMDPADAPDLARLTTAYRQLAARARARGIKAVVATVMPFEGVPFAGFYSPEKERLRNELNQWLRDHQREFDGLIDLDAIMRDPAHPSRFVPGMHTANNFGPNDAGERRIANAIDLGLFR